MFKNKINYLLLLFILPSFLLIACSKDSSTNELSYTINDNNTWHADKVESYIINDSLLISGKKNNNKSEIIIIVSDVEVGDYPITVGDLSNPLENVGLKALIIVNPTGSKELTDKLISTDGIVSITQIDEKKKIIRGTFDIKAIKGVDILNPNIKTIRGDFETKYRKY